MSTLLEDAIRVTKRMYNVLSGYHEDGEGPEHVGSRAVVMGEARELWCRLPPVLPMTWQPIETAPREQSWNKAKPVVLVTDGKTMMFASWQPPMAETSSGYWWEYLPHCPSDNRRCIDPTHWMLVELPK